MHADGVRVEKNVLVPMRDGVRLAADLYLPDPDPGKTAAGGHGVHPVPQGRGRPRDPLLRVPPAATATSSPASTSAARAPREGINADEYMLQEQLDGSTRSSGSRASRGATATST